jgi:UV DNA damage repair endonuclease
MKLILKQSSFLRIDLELDDFTLLNRETYEIVASSILSLPLHSTILFYTHSAFYIQRRALGVTALLSKSND